MQLTKEKMERAAACENAKELQAWAKSEGLELTDEEAEACFAKLRNVQVSDDELDAVAGGFINGGFLGMTKNDDNSVKKIKGWL